MLEKNQVGKTLIFCKTKHKVDEVGEALQRMGERRGREERSDPIRT